jgi:hypothetical protein
VVVVVVHLLQGKMQQTQAPLAMVEQELLAL